MEKRPISLMTYSGTSCNPESRMNKMIPIFLGVVLFGAVTFAVYVLFLRGIYVEVRNLGPKDLTNVIVEVTGNQYNLGTLAPKTTKKIKIEPKGESGVEIQFEIPDAIACSIPSRGYFEAGFMYHGTVTIELGSTSCEAQIWADHTKFSLF